MSRPQKELEGVKIPDKKDPDARVTMLKKAMSEVRVRLAWSWGRGEGNRNRSKELGNQAHHVSSI